MNKPFYKGRLSINKEKSSPYWMVTFQGPDGKMRLINEILSSDANTHSML